MERLGVSAALLTPFSDDGSIDEGLLAAHAKGLLDSGVDSVTLFGTTGEAASVSRAERPAAIEALLGAGCPADRINLGLCATSTGDAAEQAREGLSAGITSFLVPPHFYFKDCGDQGHLEWHSRLIERTDPAARFILYHIPQVTEVAISLELVARLKERFGDRLRAIKDSSSDWENTKALIGQGALPVLVGDERMLARSAAAGGAGAISGTTNIHPERIRRLYESKADDPVLIEEITRIVSVPVIPSLKAVMAKTSGNPAWERVRPPLEQLGEGDRKTLFSSQGTAG